MRQLIRLLKGRLRDERGQSATEFALILPFILMFSFFIMQMSILFTMTHQMSWASYAAARFHNVACKENCGGSHLMDNSANGQKVVDAILRSDVWQKVGAKWSTSNDGGAGIVGGGYVEINPNKQGIPLPYVRHLSWCTEFAGGECQQFSTWKSPTHLGPNVWGNQYPDGGDTQRSKRQGTGSVKLTDNNIDDYK